MDGRGKGIDRDTMFSGLSSHGNILHLGIIILLLHLKQFSWGKIFSTNLKNQILIEGPTNVHISK